MQEQNTKIAWMAAGIALAGAIVTACIISVVKDRQAEKEMVSFVTDTVTDISDGWHARALKERSEPGLVAAMASQGQSIEQLFSIYRKLGALTEMPVCTVKDTSQFEGVSQSFITASCTCDAHYDKGPATLLITIRRPKKDDDWKVYYINVNSPAFSQANSGNQ